MTLTGHQIREAREALGWEAWQVAKAAGVSVSEVILAEVADGCCLLEIAHAQAIQRVLEAAGVEFTIAPAGVRLQQARQSSDEAAR